MANDWNEHEIRTLINLKSRGYSAKVIGHALDRTQRSVECQWGKVKPKKIPYAGKENPKEEWSIHP